ncbi:hypothetical protein BH09MYX1_BH09MYX1_26990 [soil metagenome]
MASFGLSTHDGSLAAAAFAGHDALTRPLAQPVELVLAELVEEGELLGSFQRRSEARTSRALARRATGGASVLTGPGIAHGVLALASPGALMPANEDQILNRYVRPFLAAITKVAAPAHYFGRDWISVSHRPAAHLSFAHCAETRRTVVEVFVALSRGFCAGARSSHLGKEPILLDEVARIPVTVERLRAALVDGLAERHALEATAFTAARPPPIPAIAEDPPWVASVEEAIGPVSAGRDRLGALRLGGELMASFDAVAELEARLRDASRQDLDAIVDAVFTAPRVALFGVRSLRSIRDVLDAGFD